ncbi:hypothetical protein TSMEX_008976 [Taenia solium]|eukprot:TsM_000685900 transcript=TsM_000685900 gene=TsM_000685900
MALNRRRTITIRLYHRGLSGTWKRAFKGMLRSRNLECNVPPGRLPPYPPLKILFWTFYNCCREEVQLVATKKL